VQDIGQLKRGKLLTVKEIEYSVESLAPGVDCRQFEDGTFAIFFLSPVDCHRVFAPHQLQLHEIVHVPGRRLLVHPPFQRREFPVFSLNERVILRCTTPLGQCLLVLVAGWGVGNITFPFRTLLRPRRRRITRWKPPTPRHFARGEWIATFELGSTVILLLEKSDTLQDAVATNDKVNYGQIAFSYQSPRMIERRADGENVPSE
jgi:phosphatidylserine decarboxylase